MHRHLDVEISASSLGPALVPGLLRTKSVIRRKSQLDLMGNVWMGSHGQRLGEPKQPINLVAVIMFTPNSYSNHQEFENSWYLYLDSRQRKECGAKERIKRSGSRTKLWNKSARNLSHWGSSCHHPFEKCRRNHQAEYLSGIFRTFTNPVSQPIIE